MKVTIAQVNPTVGDIDENTKKLKGILDKHSEGSDIIIFPEMFITGYPPKDLLERKDFIKKVEKSIRDITLFSKKFRDTGIILGAPLRNGDNGMGLFNSAFLISNGKVVSHQMKSLLPTYDVFDEARYFDPSKSIDVIGFKGEKLGISICEDAWNDPELWHRRNYGFNPIDVLAKKGATLMINISASPFHLEKEKVRFRVVSNHAKKHKTPFIYVNQVGANDEIIFDGRSIAVDRNGRLIKALKPFEEQVITVDTETRGDDHYEPQEKMESLRDALVLGIKDYFRKCGFRKAVIGLSGGIDSAVTFALAVEALGKENVLGISMPSKFSSRGSIEDSRKLAKNLGTEFKVIPIKETHDAYLSTLEEHFRGRKPDVTEENIQARIRGNILMAFSNKFGYIVLSTGNKSEISIGYCTLYGDMSGGLAVISDVPKTMVYDLAGFINAKREIIPRDSIEKPPSAELRTGQKDQDTLPPYDELDRIIYEYVDEKHSPGEMKMKGLSPDTVDWVVSAVNRSEYKRKQAPPGLKVTTKAFGHGRRMPIAAKHE